MKQKVRKVQCYEDDESIWSYYTAGTMNPCGCGSNCYHFEFDGERVIGVCNACRRDIYEVLPEFTDKYLSKGKWVIKSAPEEGEQNV